MCKVFKRVWGALQKCDACACFLIAAFLLFSLFLLGFGTEPLKEFFVGALRFKADGAAGWFYEYQTIFAGSFVLLSVWVSVHNISKERRSKSRVAVAKLPSALSELCGYAAACYSMIESDNKEPLDQPAKSMFEVQEAMGHVDEKVYEQLYRICSFYQVFNARLERFIKTSIGTNKSDLMYDAVLLYACCADVLPTVRRDDGEGYHNWFSKAEMLSAHTIVNVSNYGLQTSFGDGLCYDVQKKLMSVVRINFFNVMSICSCSASTASVNGEAA